MKLFQYTGIALLSMGLLLTACNDDDDDYSISTTPLVTSVTTGQAEVTAVSAVATGTVQGLAGQAASAYQVGVYYATDADPKTNGTRVLGSLNDGVITTNLTGLETNVKYYFVPFVTLQNRVTYYGETVGEFVTTSATLSTTAAADVTYASAVLGASVSGTEGVPVEVGYGVKLGLSDDVEALKVGYDVASATPLDGAGFSIQKKGLLPATTYYYVPYINLGSGYVYGDVETFTTAEVEFEFVDLGLSVLWATQNIGAEAPEEIGTLAGYGDVTALLTSDDVDDYASGDIFNGKKDIAKVIGAGRLPKEEDVRELINACTADLTTENGVSVVRFTAPNGNSIVLPVASFWTGNIREGGQYATAFVAGAAPKVDAEVVTSALALRPVKKAPVAFQPAFLTGSGDGQGTSKTWYLDLDKDGESYVFGGPMYFAGTDDSWTSLSDGDAVAGDSWLWEADWKGNDWICSAEDFGSMTFYADGRVSVNGEEGTYTIDAEAKTITFEGVQLLHMGNYTDQVSNFTTSLPILSLSDEGMQIGAVRTNDPCLLVFNFISEAAYAELSKPVWQGAPASIQISDPGWWPSYWSNVDDKNCVDVTGYGTYTHKVTLDAPLNGVNVFTVDIFGYKNVFGEEVFNNTIATVDKIVVDGNEVPFDASKIVTGDLEDNGNLRLEIYNDYGATATDAPIDKAAIVGQTVEVTFTLSQAVPVWQGAPASIQISDPGWWPSYWSSATDFKCVDVTGYGTYTHSVTLDAPLNGVNVFTVDVFGYADVFGADVLQKTQATIDKIEVDGNEVAVDNSKILYGDIEGNGNFRIEIFNQYGAGTADNPPIDVAQMVGQTISVTFTLSEAAPVWQGAPASIQISDPGWWPSYWSSATDWNCVDVTGFGTYTHSVTLDAPLNGVNVFTVDIFGYRNIFGEEVFNNTVATVDKIVVDGNELPFDASKILAGDLENNGNLRLEIYNDYGDTHEDPAFAPSVIQGSKVEVTFTLSARN